MTEVQESRNGDDELIGAGKLARRDELVKELNVKLVEGNRENEDMRIEGRALRDSTSWKITAPVRWCSAGVGKCGGWIRSFIIGVLRVVYHSLPFPMHRKSVLRSKLYSKVPFLFRPTISYRYWELNKEVDGVVEPKSKGTQKKTKHQCVVRDFSHLLAYSDKRDAYAPLNGWPGKAQGLNNNSRMIDESFDREIERVNKSHDEWFNLICKSLQKSIVTCKGIPLPAFPDVETQVNTVGAAGVSNLIEADLFFRDVVWHFCGSPNWRKPERKVLDFGCGWGRIARFFLLYFKPENIFGIDIDDDLLNICRNTFYGSKFYKCQAFPPTIFENYSIDYIVGYSVFSHLSEKACHEWMKEFKRILKSGGIVALTTRGRPFFDYCISLKGTRQSGYLDALSGLFDDFDSAKRKYDAGEFVHSNVKGVTGGGVREAEFYGESFIPERYARDVLSKYLSFVEFSFDCQRSIHPTIYFKKE